MLGSRTRPKRGRTDEAAARAVAERRRRSARKREAGTVVTRRCRWSLGSGRPSTVVSPGAVDDGVDPGRRRSNPDAAAATRTASSQPTLWAPGAWTSCAEARGGRSACRRKRSAAADTSPWRAEESCGWIGSTTNRERGWMRKEGDAENWAPGEGKGRAWDLSSWAGSEIWPSHALPSPTRGWDGWASCREDQVEIEA